MTDYQTLEVQCPACDASDWVEVEVLIGFGGVPQTKHRCSGCRKTLTIEAMLDVCVSEDDA